MTGYTPPEEDNSLSSYKTDPVPNFGHDLLKYWSFERGYINLNNGSYGSLPYPVSQACAKFEALTEASPDKFFRYTYRDILPEIRERLAKFIGVDIDEVVMVPNATHGVNTVLRNFEWKAGDVIVKMNLTYGAVARTTQYLCDISPHVTLSTIDIDAPITHAKILDNFRARILAIKASPGFTDQSKIVVVTDAITSNPGLYMPWQQVVQICREEGVWSIVDAAHSIGQEMDINLSESKPDFWISNCHKWLYAKRGCAVLYVPKRNQYMMKSTIPTSFGYVIPEDQEYPDAPEAPNFVNQFEWTGTNDYSTYLSVDAALDFREWLGGETKINAYTRSLALAGGKRVAEILGTSLLDETDNSELTLNMANVKLPLPDTPDKAIQKEILSFLTKQTLYEWNFAAPVFHFSGAWWTRLSAQVWNEMSDFEYAAKGMAAICKTILETIIDEKGEARAQSV